jgi:outer membrane murein-binding lipoprotein Lpp
MPELTDQIIHTRLAVVETKIGYIEDAVKGCSTKLEEMHSKVDNISNHISKQNGALPGLEHDMSIVLARLNTAEKEAAQTSIKTKITWGLLSTIIVGILVSLAKFVLRF